ncbi:NAD(P)-dependent alcohol dehydrogenase [Deinococcus sp. QL22]|uniref:NAD(P)-dependent alcohol dehydrogenase n=1 Tax=Deinococcus sp. QL22 TaxID=2939437 RepID=UPI00201711D2|nr:NAD(P)-dependent alcohol dehydrogenase [Deinococcus sp. QL22]UQN09470.1 NAD(P)-dependent alcohol dehydrogenase [Deinococcus sp. QL22]
MMSKTARIAPPFADRRTMQAVVRDRYGSADLLQLRQVELPTITGDQVLLRVHAAGLDRGAWHIMTGRPYLMRLAGFGLRAPKNRTLGSDVAGVVVAVGPQVTDFRPGDRVFGTCFGTSHGSFAEYAVARTNKLARMPADTSFEQAAVVPGSAQTALQALRDHGRVQAGQRVLIIGASGGVGSFAVQLAKAFGAVVTGVCSTAKVNLVQSLGADHVIDYSSTDLAQMTERYDLVLDIGGNRSLSRLRRLLTAHGTLVLVGGEAGDRWTGGLGRQVGAMLISRFVPQRLVSFITKENSADLETLARMIEAGTLIPQLDRITPLAGVADAMHDLEAGRVSGKVAVSVAS